MSRRSSSPNSLRPRSRSRSARNGVLLWRGEFQTPVYGPRDAMWVTVRTLMEGVDHGINQLTLPVPADQRRTGVLGATITAQPVRVDAPLRGSRGQTAGWAVSWVEVQA